MVAAAVRRVTVVWVVSIVVVMWVMGSQGALALDLGGCGSQQVNV